MLAAKFQKNLTRQRKAAGLSQDKLARKAGISVSYISMLERGLRTPPLETIEAVAGALRVSPVSMLS